MAAEKLLQAKKLPVRSGARNDRNMSAMVKAAPQGGKVDFGLYHKLSCQARIRNFGFNGVLALSFRARVMIQRARNDEQEFNILLIFRRRGIATRWRQQSLKERRVHVEIKSSHRAVGEEEVDAAMRGT